MLALFKKGYIAIARWGKVRAHPWCGCVVESGGGDEGAEKCLAVSVQCLHFICTLTRSDVTTCGDYYRLPVASSRWLPHASSGGKNSKIQ